jgi:hypothetical protein
MHRNEPLKLQYYQFIDLASFTTWIEALKEGSTVSSCQNILLKLHRCYTMLGRKWFLIDFIHLVGRQYA